MLAEPFEGVVRHTTRRVARAWLHGSLTSTRELLGPEDLMAQEDERAAALLGTARSCAATLERLTSFDNDRFLPVNQPLALRIDACEVAAWGAFVAHIRAPAGE